MSVSEHIESEKPGLVAVVNGKVLKPGESVKLPDIPERLRNGGLPVLIGDEIESKKVRKALYRDWKATFALYGEPNYVVVSYSREIDDELKQHIINITQERISAASYEKAKGLEQTMNNDLNFLQSQSYSWFDNPDRIATIEEFPSEELQADMLKMESILRAPRRRIIGRRYSFRSKPEILLPLDQDFDKNIKLTMIYHMVK